MDQFGFPRTNTGYVKIFNATTSVNGQGYQIWTKPKGATLVNFLAIGGGGGGGGGFTRTAGNAGGGGAGGACSGLARFTCPAIVLPDVLYVQVGGGGPGGTASGNGTAGTNSYVSTSPITGTPVLPNLIVYSGVNVPGGGGAGAAGAGGTGGTVPTVAVTQPPNTWGQWFGIVGIVGAAGGAQTGANGTGVTCWATIPLSPGAGGAGCTTTDFNGGLITATALLDISNLGHYASSAGAVAKGGDNPLAGPDRNGSGGVKRITPFYNSGGAGGASDNTAIGGAGGGGGYGCGGGGGGAGATGGIGGNGGDGVVIISCV